MIISRILPCNSRRLVLSYTVLCVALSTIVSSQSIQIVPKNTVADAINEIKHGQVTPAGLQRIVQARATEAVPILHEQFARIDDDLLKDAIASTLVRLGDDEPKYWDFLESHASQAVQNDAPFPFDLQGATGRKQFSQEFLEWTKTKNADPQAAALDQMRTLPAEITFLAVTGDPRGLALLRKGLGSRNYLIQAMAARGLAKLHDVDSVPLIVAACKRVPAEPAALIARSLVFFDTPQAQSAAETFIRDHEVLEELRKLNKEKGANSLF